jgi:hypothetical protein
VAGGSTWPASSNVLFAWFPPEEQGRAWGIMSTAGRSGIIITALGAAAAGGTTPARFVGVGSILWGAAALVFLCFRECPPRLPGGRGVAASDATSTKKPNDGSRSLSAEMWRLCAVPPFWNAMAVQATALPAIEFQSQLSILLAADPALPPSLTPLGTTLFHLGIMLSVVGAGFLLDRCTAASRGVLIGGPMLVSASVFALLSVGGSLTSGVRKLPCAFLIGAGAAPAAYLVMTLFVSKHSAPSAKATVCSVIDVAGYLGNLCILQFATRAVGSAAAAADTAASTPTVDPALIRVRTIAFDPHRTPQTT